LRYSIVFERAPELLCIQYFDGLDGRKPRPVHAVISEEICNGTMLTLDGGTCNVNRTAIKLWELVELRNGGKCGLRKMGGYVWNGQAGLSAFLGPVMASPRQAAEKAPTEGVADHVQPVV
jgi:hypothetical protein